MRSVCLALLDLVYPRACAGCEGPVGGESAHLCWDCLRSMDLLEEPFCRICGDPVEGVVEHRYVCSVCRRRAPYFDRARSAARFAGPLRTVVHRFKYGQAAFLADDLAGLLIACARDQYPETSFDGVLFVPLYAVRERERTYNQAELLARRLANAVGAPLFPRFLKRIRPTTTQTDLNTRERRANVRGAFAVSDPLWVEGRSLLLVDDVMTTGATVNECSRVLKAAGAAQVCVATLARG